MGAIASEACDVLDKVKKIIKKEGLSLSDARDLARELAEELETEACNVLRSARAFGHE